jgi:lysozyme
MNDTIVDLNHRGQPDFSALVTAGITAVIHKATEGGTFQDPEFPTRRVAAKAAGLLWSSYHFVSGVSVTDQLDNYVEYAQPSDDELVCIDYERSTSGPDMSLAQLERFVVLLTQQIGRPPVIYGGDLLRQSVGLNPSPVLAQCPLWYARYGPQPTGMPPGIWPTYTLWQYTDGASGPQPHAVVGLGRCDRSRYDGTEAHLQRAWPFSGPARARGVAKRRRRR